MQTVQYKYRSTTIASEITGCICTSVTVGRRVNNSVILRSARYRFIVTGIGKKGWKEGW